MPQPVSLQIAPPAKNLLPPSKPSQSSRLLEPKANLLQDTADARSGHGTRFRDTLKRIERKQTEARPEENDGKSEDATLADSAAKPEGKTARAGKGRRRGEAAKEKRDGFDDASKAEKPVGDVRADATSETPDAEDAEAAGDEASAEAPVAEK